MLTDYQLTGAILEDSSQRPRWDSFVAEHPAGHLLQSWAWGDFKSRHRWPVERVIITPEGSSQIVAGAQVLFRHVAGLSIAYVPRGPVIDWTEPGHVKALLKSLRQVCKRHRAVYLKIEPAVIDEAGFERELGLYYGFQPSQETVQPRSTIRVDLSGEPQTWLERMKPKTRYNIRLAEKRGVTCRLADPSNPVDFQNFFSLMGATGQRDTFGIHSAAYYRDVWQTFSSSPTGSGSGALWLAEFGGNVIAGVMVFAFAQESAYLYGVSSDENRREMPTYLLQWQAMQWARQQGARYYDFWGIPDDLGAGDEPDNKQQLEHKNVRDGLWGVYRFKQGFGGEVARYVGAFDLVYNRPLYALWQQWQGRKIAD